MRTEQLRLHMRKAPESVSLAILVVLMLVVPTASYSQTGSSMIPRPTLSKGDTYTYDTVSSRFGQRVSTFIFQGIDDGRLHFIRKLFVRGEQRGAHRFYKTMDLADIELSGVYKNHPHDGLLKFPLTVGASWKQPFDFVPGRGNTTSRTRSCEVAGREQKVVPAGKFEAYRIRCENENHSGNGRGAAYLVSNEEFWYAPSVGAVIEFKSSIGSEYYLKSYSRNGK